MSTLMLSGIIIAGDDVGSMFGNSSMLFGCWSDQYGRGIGSGSLSMFGVQDGSGEGAGIFFCRPRGNGSSYDSFLMMEDHGCQR